MVHSDKIFLKIIASGIDFLGCVHFPKYRILRETTKNRVLRRIKNMPTNESLQSYLGLLKHGNAQKIRHEVLGCFWLWKRCVLNYFFKDAIVFYMKQTKIHYNLIFRPEPEGGFTVLVPSLPGCISYGKNFEEAREMISDAIEGYIKSLRKHKETIPNDNKSFVTSLDFDLPLSYAAAS